MGLVLHAIIAGMPCTGALAAVNLDFEVCVETSGTSLAPAGISFGPDGRLYIGTDENTSPVYSITECGQEAVHCGPSVGDPDITAVDVLGVVTGVPGSVLIGRTGEIHVFADCDDTVGDVLLSTSELGNISDMVFDQDGRLLVCNQGSTVYQTTDGSTLSPFATGPTGVNSLTVDIENRVWVLYTDGSLEVRDPQGGLLASMATGYTIAKQIAAGLGGASGIDVYLAAQTSMSPNVSELSFARYEDGNITLSFLRDQIPGAAQGLAVAPDGALFMSMGGQFDVLRLDPLLDVPAVSSWGLIGMSLGLLTAATLALRRTGNGKLTGAC